MGWEVCIKRKNLEDKGEKDNKVTNILIEERRNIVTNQIETLGNQCRLASNIFRAAILLFSIIISVSGLAIRGVISTNVGMEGIVELIPESHLIIGTVVLYYFFIFLLAFVNKSVKNSLYILDGRDIPEKMSRDNWRFDTIRGTENKERLYENQKTVIKELTEIIEENEEHIENISKAGRRSIYSISSIAFTIVTIEALRRTNFGSNLLSTEIYLIMELIIALLGPIMTYTYLTLREGK